jgi:hypothetical protein
VQVACTINYGRNACGKKWEKLSKIMGAEGTAVSATMTLQEKILYHQIHPLKLAADIGCEPVSLYFFWQHDLLLGLVTHLVPPVVASLWLISRANLEAYKDSAGGAFLRRHMTRTIEAIRLAGDILMAVGAWVHSPWLIALGVTIVVLAWTSGFMRKVAIGRDEETRSR